MTKTKWCVIQKTKTKTKSEFAVKYNTVAEALIKKYPCLKEPGSFNGCYGWIQKLKYKMNNFRSKFRSVGSPEMCHYSGFMLFCRVLVSGFVLCFDFHALLCPSSISSMIFPLSSPLPPCMFASPGRMSPSGDA